MGEPLTPEGLLAIAERLNGYLPDVAAGGYDLARSRTHDALVLLDLLRRVAAQAKTTGERRGACPLCSCVPSGAAPDWHDADCPAPLLEALRAPATRGAEGCLGCAKASRSRDPDLRCGLHGIGRTPDDAPPGTLTLTAPGDVTYAPATEGPGLVTERED